MLQSQRLPACGANAAAAGICFRTSCHCKGLGAQPTAELARRYDQGCQGITNIDFDKGVIAEMLRKNLRQRPRMRWQVADMTSTKVRALAC